MEQQGAEKVSVKGKGGEGGGDVSKEARPAREELKLLHPVRNWVRNYQKIQRQGKKVYYYIKEETKGDINIYMRDMSLPWKLGEVAARCTRWTQDFTQTQCRKERAF